MRLSPIAIARPKRASPGRDLDKFELVEWSRWRRRHGRRCNRRLGGVSAVNRHRRGRPAHDLAKLAQRVAQRLGELGKALGPERKKRDGGEEGDMDWADERHADSILGGRQDSLLQRPHAFEQIGDFRVVAELERPLAGGDAFADPIGARERVRESHPRLV